MTVVTRYVSCFMPHTVGHYKLPSSEINRLKACMARVCRHFQSTSLADSFSSHFLVVFFFPCRMIMWRQSAPKHASKLKWSWLSSSLPDQNWQSWFTFSWHFHFKVISWMTVCAVMTSTFMNTSCIYFSWNLASVRRLRQKIEDNTVLM